MSADDTGAAGTKRRRWPEMESQSEEVKLDKYRMKVESEASMGVVSAFLGGCAISILTEYDQEKALHMPPLVASTYVLALALCCALCLCSVMLDSALYFAGMRMLSGRMSVTRAEALDLFAGWWDTPLVKLARRLSRDMVLLMPILLLGVISLGLFGKLSAPLAVASSCMMVGLPACIVMLCVKLMGSAGHRVMYYSARDFSVVMGARGAQAGVSQALGEKAD